VAAEAEREPAGATEPATAEVCGTRENHRAAVLQVAASPAGAPRVEAEESVVPAVAVEDSVGAVEVAAAGARDTEKGVVRAAVGAARV
jgi:hypothetical protein